MEFGFIIRLMTVAIQFRPFRHTRRGEHGKDRDRRFGLDDTIIAGTNKPQQGLCD